MESSLNSLNSSARTKKNSHSGLNLYTPKYLSLSMEKVKKPSLSPLSMLSVRVFRDLMSEKVLLFADREACIMIRPSLVMPSMRDFLFLKSRMAFSSIMRMALSRFLLIRKISCWVPAKV